MHALQTVQVGQQVVRVFLGEDVFERWHLVFAILQDLPYLCVGLLGMRLAQLAMKTWSETNLIGKNRVTLKTSLRKDLLTGVNRLFLCSGLGLSMSRGCDYERKKYGQDQLRCRRQSVHPRGNCVVSFVRNCRNACINVAQGFQLRQTTSICITVRCRSLAHRLLMLLTLSLSDIRIQGRQKATYIPPLCFGVSLPPPAAMTTYCLPSTM